MSFWETKWIWKAKNLRDSSPSAQNSTASVGLPAEAVLKMVNWGQQRGCYANLERRLERRLRLFELARTQVDASQVGVTVAQKGMVTLFGGEALEGLDGRFVCRFRLLGLPGAVIKDAQTAQVIYMVMWYVLARAGVLGLHNVGHVKEYL